MNGDTREPSVQLHHGAPLLQVRNLVKRFETRTRRWFSSHVESFDAVADVSFDVQTGETFGIVGESGSGKTTLARCILRALQPTSGEAIFTHRDRSVDLATLDARELKPLRQQMQMIFQDPFSSLNPRMTVGDIVAEPLVIHRIGTRAERLTRVAAMLHRVGLSQDHMQRYPHAFSGGQRQRIGIARALILRPALIVADEAVSALDVSVQSHILDLLQQLRTEFKLTTIFVSHDLSIVRQLCDRVAVMHRGRIVEMGTSEQIFTQPRHAYTRVLLSAIPYPDPDRPFNPLRVKDLTPKELEPL